MPPDNPRPWLIITGDFTPRGGMDLANFELARYLADNTLAPIHLVAHRIDESLRSQRRVVCHQVARPAGRHIIGAMLLGRMGRRVARSLQGERPYIVVNGGNCRLPAVNWAHYVHSKCRCQNRGAPWLFRLKNLIGRYNGIRAERSAFRSSRLIIANSDKTRRDLIETIDIPPEHIQTVYLGVDPSQFLPIGDEERRAVRADLKIAGAERILLFVGVLGYDRNKGFDTLLNAMRILKNRQRNESIRLLAVGFGKLDYWRKLADEAGVGNLVQFLGARNDVSRLMAAADVLVSPTRYDSYGLAVHEALCRGLPAIVAKTAGVAERVPRELAELILPDPEDAGDLAARIEKTLVERPRLQPFLDSFSDRLRRWTWTDMAAEMVRLIESHF